MNTPPRAARPASGQTRRPWALRRIWLPGLLYAALPWIYCSLGAIALLAGLYVPEPVWMLPYLFLLAVTTIHAGLWFIVLRRRYRCRHLRRQRQRGTAGQTARQDAGRRASPDPAAM